MQLLLNILEQSIMFNMILSKLYFVEYGILTPKNSEVNSINSCIINLYPRQEIEYLSTNSINNILESNINN
ncbi:19285_t:CDS:2 [Cetraspora pellucida]|uniref:19285_t:CDS:1 n=1 Tax=Cetraspora pellucida TaxID=1433469 RepID=A0A9N9J7L1_9GLOM|nr:19285_t:CDS:2 [Cetraspora pellucida]